MSILFIYFVRFSFLSGALWSAHLSVFAYSMADSYEISRRVAVKRSIISVILGLIAVFGYTG